MQCAACRFERSFKIVLHFTWAFSLFYISLALLAVLVRFLQGFVANQLRGKAQQSVAICRDFELPTDVQKRLTIEHEMNSQMVSKAVAQMPEGMETVRPNRFRMVQGLIM